MAFVASVIGPYRKWVMGPGCVDESHCTLILSPALAVQTASDLGTVFPLTLHVMSLELTLV